ncbi:unnamed protein product [Amoebophrya sp. A25]|nr:unnamed protein product [Amoebophrya sp. A25]|eukprot:GSA25T00025686001.1
MMFSGTERLDRFFLIQDAHTRGEVQKLRQDLSSKHKVDYVPIPAAGRAPALSMPKFPRRSGSLDRAKGEYTRSQHHKEEFPEVVNEDAGIHVWTQDARGADLHNLESPFENATGEDFGSKEGKYYYRARQYPLYPQIASSSPRTAAMKMEDFLNRTLSLAAGPRGRGNFRSPKGMRTSFVTQGASSKSVHAPMLLLDPRTQHTENGSREDAVEDSKPDAAEESQHKPQNTSVIVDLPVEPPIDRVFLMERRSASMPATKPRDKKKKTTTLPRIDGAAKPSRTGDDPAKLQGSMDDPSPAHRKRLADGLGVAQPSELLVDREDRQGGDGGGDSSGGDTKGEAVYKSPLKKQKRRGRSADAASDEDGDATDAITGRSYILMTATDVARIPIKNESHYKMVWRLTCKSKPEYFSVMPHREGVIAPGDSFEMRLRLNPALTVPQGVYQFKLAMGDLESVWLTQTFVCVVPERDDVRAVQAGGRTYKISCAHGPPKQTVTWREQSHKRYAKWLAEVPGEKVVLPPIDKLPDINNSLLAPFGGNPKTESRTTTGSKQRLSAAAEVVDIPLSDGPVRAKQVAGPTKTSKEGFSSSRSLAGGTTGDEQQRAHTPSPEVLEGHQTGVAEGEIATIVNQSAAESELSPKDMLVTDATIGRLREVPFPMRIELPYKRFPLEGMAAEAAAKEAAERGLANAEAEGALSGEPEETLSPVRTCKKKATIVAGEGAGSSKKKMRVSASSQIPVPAMPYTDKEATQLLYDRKPDSFARAFPKDDKTPKKREQLEYEVVKIANRPKPKLRPLKEPKTPVRTAFDMMAGTLQKYAAHYDKRWGGKRKSQHSSSSPQQDDARMGLPRHLEEDEGFLEEALPVLRRLGDSVDSPPMNFYTETGLYSGGDQYGAYSTIGTPPKSTARVSLLS